MPIVRRHKRNISGTRKLVRVESHGAAYRLQNGKLEVAPLLQSGGIDFGSWTTVEMSPRGYKKTHTKVARKLGSRSPSKVVSWISYY